MKCTVLIKFRLPTICYLLDAGDCATVVHENKCHSGIIQEVSENHTIFECYHSCTFH